MEKYNKKELDNLINVQKLSYSEIGRIFNVSGNAIKKAAIRLGIFLKPRRKINEKENFSHSHKSVKIISLVEQVTDEEFINIMKTSCGWNEIGQKLGYKSNLSSKVKARIFERCSKLGIEPNIFKGSITMETTKGELFKNRKNWQSARSSIRQKAQMVYDNSNKPKRCAICGYDKHIEIAHIKAVSEFDDNATIAEINSVDNLIGLCPNHHWEYDHGILEI